MEDFIAASRWLKSRPDSGGRIGVTGFCYGGEVSNTLAVRMGADLAAAAPFYGDPPPLAEVPKMKAAILVHHGALDKPLVDAWPRYEAELKKANIIYEVTSIQTLVTGSTMMRLRSALTKTRRIAPGSALSSGSTSTCGVQPVLDATERNVSVGFDLIRRRFDAA